MKLVRTLGLSFVAIGCNISNAFALPFGDIAKIARPITVLITNSNGSQGTGVIINKVGQKYTVLTAAHVLCGNSYYNKCDRQLKYTIATVDRQYVSRFKDLKLLPDRFDLATIEFNSNRIYSVAKLGNSDRLQIGMNAYVAGFPAPTAAIEKSVFIAHAGKIVAVAAGNRRINKNGYGTIYDTTTLPGMSGGGVFDDNGEVIAIHGQGDRDAETGAKTGNNLGIPINNFIKLANQIGIVNTAKNSQIDRPQTANEYLITAASKYNDGDRQGSANDLNFALKLDPNSAAALYQRGYIRAQMGLDRQALSDLDRAISLAPDRAKAYLERGTIKSKLKDERGAIADFDRAIALDPNLLTTYNRRANLRDKSGNATGAISDYTIAIQRHPERANLYYQRGLAYARSGNKSAALTDLDRSIQLNQRYAIAYYDRAKLRLELQDRARAISDLQQAAKFFKMFGNSPLYREVTQMLDRLSSK